jgi:hypothetical protein
LVGIINVRVPSAALCVLAVVLQLSRIASGEARSIPKAALSSAALVSPAPAVYHFTVAERIFYRLYYTSASESNFGPLLGAGDQKAQPSPLGVAQSFRTTVQAEFTVSVLDLFSDNVLVAYSLRNSAVRLIANGQAADAEAETIKKDLGRDVFALVSRQGKVLSVRCDPAANTISQNFARALIAVTQFVFPSTPSSNRSQWETQEDDPNGQYIARYQQAEPGSNRHKAPQPSLRTFRKIKTRYLQAVQKPGPDEFNLATVITPKGELTANFDLRAGRILALSGAESETIEMGGKTVARARNAVRLNYVGREILDPAKLAAMREASSQRSKLVAAVPLSVMTSKEDSELSIERTELGSATLESLLADLANLESSSGERDETPLYLKFKALIYLHPESSAPLGEILETAPAKGLTMRVLAGALGAVGHQEAQAALVSAISARSKDWPALSMLIPALDEANLPSQLAEDTVRDLALRSRNADVAFTAQLTLGTMARNLAETSPERATKIVELFIKQVESSPSVDATRQALLALGNAGSANAYSTITRFLTDSSPALRAAAALALRWVPSERVDAELTRALTSDPEATVRLEAAVALGFRQMTDGTFEAQKRAFLTDKNDKVRLALLSNLWKVHQAFPAVSKLVRDAAAKDASQDVRKAARDIMAIYPEGYFNK